MALAVLATGTDEMAARVVTDNLGRGLSRMGESHTKGLGYMADATDATALTMAYKEARIAIQHQAEIEKAVVRIGERALDQRRRRARRRPRRSSR